MKDRFRIDGVDLGVDRRASFATVDGTGIADASIRAAALFDSARSGAAGSGAAQPDPVPLRLVITRVPLRFDGEVFGATVDAELRDRLFVEALDDDDPDALDADAGAGAGADADADADADAAPAVDAGVSLHAGSRSEADGRLTHHAGDRLRFVGEVRLPGFGAPLRLDVALAFGGRRRASV